MNLRKPFIFLTSIAALSLCVACGEAVEGESEIDQEISSLMAETSEDSQLAPCDFEARRAEFLQRHDTDGDGELSADEKRAAKEAKRARILEAFDANEDGTLDEAEREVAREARRDRREARRARIIQCFDADGDGVLSESEREVARETLPKKRRHRRGGGERGGESRPERAEAGN